MSERTGLLFVLAFLSCLETLAAGQAGELLAPLNAPQESFHLEVRFDPANRLLEASGVIRIKNSSGLEFGQLGLCWADQSARRMIATVGDRIFELDGTSPEPQILVLQPPLGPDQEAEIAVQFEREMPELKAGGEIKLIDWYPRLWWGYETHGAYEINLEVPPEVVTAASARRDPVDGHYRADHIRSFGLYFCEGCEVTEADVGETLVRAVIPPQYRDLAKLLLENAVDAIGFYQQKFGFYPQSSLTIIPGEPPPVSGGFPFATAMFAIHGLQADPGARETHWKWIVAHEIGHQYWLEHVLPYEPESRWGWLMIGLGLMSDRDYCRARGLDDLHAPRLLRYADTVRQGMDTTVEQSAEQIRKLKYDYNSRVTHDKAYGILSALAALVGRKTFERIEARCLSDFSGRRLGAVQFRQVVEEETEQDMGWFFGPMLKTNQFASCEADVIEETQLEAGFVSKVELRHTGSFRIPVPVEVRFEDGITARRWAGRLSEKQTLEIRSRTPIAEVIIDPDHEFPLVIPPPNEELQELSRRLVELPWTGVGEEAVDLYQRAKQLGLRDNQLLLKLSLLLFDGNYYQQALENFSRMAATITNPQEQVVEFYLVNVWQGMLLDLMGERDRALAHYQQALSTGLDPRIQHSQYDLILNRKFVEERLKQPFERD